MGLVLAGSLISITSGASTYILAKGIDRATQPWGQKKCCIQNELGKVTKAAGYALSIFGAAVAVYSLPLGFLVPKAAVLFPAGLAAIAAGNGMITMSSRVTSISKDEKNCSGMTELFFKGVAEGFEDIKAFFKPIEELDGERRSQFIQSLGQ